MQNFLNELVHLYELSKRCEIFDFESVNSIVDCHKTNNMGCLRISAWDVAVTTATSSRLDWPDFEARRLSQICL